MARQKKLPCVIMRGGTSRGPYLLASDLPADSKARDEVLLALMGAGHILQVDGIGGANPLTSKVAIVSRSSRPGIDVDYLFAQVGIDTRMVDTKPNCGNMLAGVGPFAIEAGLVKAGPERTTVRIFNVNTGARIDSVVRTPGGEVDYDGDTAIPGAPGTAARIDLLFRDFVGAKTGKLFPSGKASEEIDGIEVTLIDSAMPMMLMRADAVGLEDIRNAEALEAQKDVLARIETMRLEGGRRMGFGDVSGSVIPKVGLLEPRSDCTIGIAYLMPWQVHKALAVTGAVCMATAVTSPGTVAQKIAGPFTDIVRFGHPSGIMELATEMSDGKLTGAGVVRTARRVFEGYALVPAHLYAERTAMAAE